MPASAAFSILSWAAVAPQLGAYDDARTVSDALKAPAIALVATVVCSCALSSVLSFQPPALQLWLVTLLETALLIAGWRLVYFGLERGNSAIDAVVLALKDEDGGDDDF